MTIEYYGKSSNKKKQGKKRLMMFIIGMFSLILFLLIYTSFYGNISLTGSAIKEWVTNSNESGGNIRLDAKLTVPYLSIDGEFEKIEIRGGSDSYLSVGDQKFYLGDIKENYLIFDNYDGKISFDSENILELKGKASGITVNGVFITPQSKSTAKININQSFNYKSLKIDDEFSINELSYMTSGIIKLNNEKEIFNIDEEEITVNNFYGNLLIKNKELYLDGYIDSLDIIGDSNIHIEN